MSLHESQEREAIFIGESLGRAFTAIEVLSKEEITKVISVFENFQPIALEGAENVDWKAYKSIENALRMIRNDIIKNGPRRKS